MHTSQPLLLVSFSPLSQSRKSSTKSTSKVKFLYPSLFFISDIAVLESTRLILDPGALETIKGNKMKIPSFGEKVVSEEKTMLEEFSLAASFTVRILSTKFLQIKFK